MANLRAIIHGPRNDVSRLGHKEITTSTDGWNAGVDVRASRTAEGTDQFDVTITGGSNGVPLDICGLAFRIKDGVITYLNEKLILQLKKMEEKNVR